EPPPPLPPFPIKWSTVAVTVESKEGDSLDAVKLMEQLALSSSPELSFAVVDALDMAMEVRTGRREGGRGREGVVRGGREGGGNLGGVGLSLIHI
ncbi:hypothetical protein CBR_g90392, partial [Chara braunii]